MEAGKFVSQIEEFTEEDFVAKTVTPLADLKKLATKDIRYRMELYNSYLQAQVMRQLCVYEPVKIFQIDPWMRVRKEGKGGGITCVLQDGMFFFCFIKLYLKRFMHFDWLLFITYSSI